MNKLGAMMVMATLATSTAWAQMNDRSSARAGSDRPAGVVTGGTGDGGIALHRDSKSANAAVPAVSGGVSVNARDAMRATEQNANIKLVFSLNTGNYVSDVQVKVTDKAGRTLIDDVSNGPWLFAKLPAGSYTAIATYNGHTVKQNFSVANSGMRTANLRWPASVEAQAVGAASTDAGGQILGTGPQEPRR
jgi:hypothetical protein